MIISSIVKSACSVCLTLDPNLSFRKGEVFMNSQYNRLRCPTAISACLYVRVKDFRFSRFSACGDTDRKIEKVDE